MKIKATNLHQVSNDLRKKMIKELRSEEMRQGVGKILVDHIQDNPVGPASENTIKTRLYLEEANETHPKYSTPLINTTFTGELMDDLQNNVKTDFSGTSVGFIVEHSDKKHSRYIKPDGRPVKSKQRTYKQLQKYLKDKGYDYMKFSQGSVDKLLTFVHDRLIKKLKA